MLLILSLIFNLDTHVKIKLSEPEVRNKIGEKLVEVRGRGKFSDTEAKYKLKNLLLVKPEFKDKVRYKILNTEVIKDEEVKGRLLSFIEE